MLQLPSAHQDVALFLLDFFSQVSQVTENQMNTRNLSLCLAPTLFGKKKHVRKISRLQNRVSQVMGISYLK